ncbi:MAG: 3-deoxy-manno-octulosonate cytidylyltransferase [Gemmatimonadaceae bacterium]
MRTLAVIPARLGATRLPRKPLRLLAGLPLVVRVWQRVQQLGVADRCVIATESEEVVRAAHRAGAEADLTDPQHPSGTDRVAEVAARREYRGYDAILNVQGDEPFVSEAALRGAADLVGSGEFELGTAATRAPLEALGAPHVVKVIATDDGRAMYFSRAPIPFLRDPAERPLLEGHVWQHVGVYAYTREALARWVALPPHPLEQIERLEQLRPLASGMAIGVAMIAETLRGGVDTEEDLARANAEWDSLARAD